MRLLSVSRENGCLIIHTDEGDRKVMLSWRGIANIEAKCAVISHSKYQTIKVRASDSKQLYKMGTQFLHS